MAVANDELAAFQEALKAKVAEVEAEAPPEPETPETSAEIPTEPPVEERPRDEQGRFVATQDEEPAKEEPPKEEELILGRFKSQEDLAEAYRNLEAKLSEQGAEVGELRQVRQEFEQLRQQVQQPAYTADEFQATLGEDPAYAAQLAYQRKDERGLQKALAEWSTVDPFSAATWVNDVKLANTTAQLRGEYEQRMQAITNYTSQQQTNQAVGELVSKFPDVNDLANEMGQVAKERPHLLTALQSGDPQVRAQVMEDLYRIARDRRQDTVQSATEQARAAQDAETRQAKTDATVASASSAPVQEDKSPVDQLKQRIVDSPGLSIQDELAKSSR